MGSSRAPSDVSASDGSIFDISKPSKPDLIETRVSLSNNSDPQGPKGDFYPTLNLIARLKKKEVIRSPQVAWSPDVEQEKEQDYEEETEL